MSGKRSRNKGLRGELQFVAFLRDEGWTTARRGAQYRGGSDSPDVLCPELAQLHFEVKRTERLSPYDAVAQARADADGAEPLRLAGDHSSPGLL